MGAVNGKLNTDSYNITLQIVAKKDGDFLDRGTFMAQKTSGGDASRIE